MSKVEVDQVDPQSGTTLTLGTSGDTVSIPSGVTLANAGTVTGIPTSALTGTIATAQIADDAVTLAKMAPGTDGNVISYDASGNPVAVATGSAGQVLTSAGAGAPPTFAAAGGVGIDQTWQNLIGSRALNTYYTNSTGGPIQVFIIGADIGNGGDIKFYYTPDGGSEIIGAGLYTNSAGGRQQMTFTVPDGDQYKCYGAGTASLVQWWELR